MAYILLCTHTHTHKTYSLFIHLLMDIYTDSTYCWLSLFSISVISNSLRPQVLQNNRLPCPSPSPRTFSNSPIWCQWCHPTISFSALPLLPSIFPSIRVFSNESALHIRWPKYCSFSFSISPSNEYSGLISFRIDWLDLLAVQGTLKSLFQHHNLKASFLKKKKKHHFFSTQPSLWSIS